MPSNATVSRKKLESPEDMAGQRVAGLDFLTIRELFDERGKDKS